MDEEFTSREVLKRLVEERNGDKRGSNALVVVGWDAEGVSNWCSPSMGIFGIFGGQVGGRTEAADGWMDGGGGTVPFDPLDRLWWKSWVTTVTNVIEFRDPFLVRFRPSLASLTTSHFIPQHRDGANPL